MIEGTKNDQVGEFVNSMCEAATPIRMGDAETTDAVKVDNVCVPPAIGKVKRRIVFDKKGLLTTAAMVVAVASAGVIGYLICKRGKNDSDGWSETFDDGAGSSDSVETVEV